MSAAHLEERVSPWLSERTFRGLGVGVVILISCLGVVQATRAHGQPFASLLIDPYGTVSGVALPGWGVEGDAPRYPDRVVEVDGHPLGDGSPHALPANALRMRLRELGAGRHVRLGFRRDDERFDATLTIRTIGADELAYLFGSYVLVGMFLAWSGILVALVSGRRQGARAYAATCWGSLLFLATLFDYHTTTALVPLFHLGRLGTALGCMWLAYAFPEPPPGAKLFRGLLWAASACVAVLVSIVTLGSPDGELVRQARRAADVFFFAGMMVVPISILGRIRANVGQSQRELRSAAAGLVLAPALIGVGMWPGGGIFYVLLPWIIAALPLSIGYALLRHNILSTTMVVRRRLFIVPLVIAAVLGSLVSFLVLRDFLWPHGERPVAAEATLLGLLALGFGFLARALGRRLFFGTTARFRPTMEQLCDEFAALRDAAAIRASVERSVSRWLSAPAVTVLEREQLEHRSELSPPDRETLSRGSTLTIGRTPAARQVLVPVRFLGEMRAVIVVPPKRRGALFTADELELLETIANLAAIALHNADVLDQLDGFRKLELDVSRRDKDTALAVLGAEVAHEVAYPLNFFRYVLRRGERGEGLDGDDVAVARDEVERLERMLGRLKRFGSERPLRTRVRLAQPVQRALDLVRDLVSTKKLRVAVAVDAELTVRAEPDPLLQVFANLIRNAAQAVDEGGSIEIRAFATPGGFTAEVSDSGPGVPPELAESLFSPWVSGRAGGTGLGLAITHRIVRSFGWQIHVSREDERTRFRVLIPGHDVTEPSGDP